MGVPPTPCPPLDPYAKLHPPRTRGTHVQGRLFTEYFLTEGIRETPEWRASLDDATAFDAFRHALRARHDALSAAASPNESTTEQDLIHPILQLDSR